MTEEHIRQLQREEKQGARYTAMMPDTPFLVFGLLSDIGWFIHLIAAAVYFFQNGFHHVLDYVAFLAVTGILLGVAHLIYLNRIHEKDLQFFPYSVYIKHKTPPQNCLQRCSFMSLNSRKALFQAVFGHRKSPPQFDQNYGGSWQITLTLIECTPLTFKGGALVVKGGALSDD